MCKRWLKWGFTRHTRTNPKVIFIVFDSPNFFYIKQYINSIKKYKNLRSLKLSCLSRSKPKITPERRVESLSTKERHRSVPSVSLSFKRQQRRIFLWLRYPDPGLGILGKIKERMRFISVWPQSRSCILKTPFCCVRYRISRKYNDNIYPTKR